MVATQISGVDQIAVAVHDLDDAIELLDRLYGLTPSHREVIESDLVEEAMIDLGGVWLQLLAPTSPESTVARFLERRGPGLHHIGFAVDDVDASLAAIRGAGVRTLDETARVGGGGNSIGFVHPSDHLGVLVELVSQPSDEAVSRVQ